VKVLIDADACPVVDIALKLCKKHHISCLLLCDTAHTIHRDGAETLVFDKGADSVDFALVNRANPGDIVITQDYGLASMCLGKRVRVLHRMAGNTRSITSPALWSSATPPKSTAYPAVAPKVRSNVPEYRTKHLKKPFSICSRDNPVEVPGQIPWANLNTDA